MAVASIRSSPDRARAFPQSMRGVAAGLRLWSVVDVGVGVGVDVDVDVDVDVKDLSWPRIIVVELKDCETWIFSAAIVKIDINFIMMSASGMQWYV